jgi:hypothetical protein
MTVTSVPDESQEPTTEQPQSLHERLEETYDGLTSSEASAEETAAATTATTDATSTTEQNGDAAPAETAAVVPEKIEVTPEQLDDNAYWGALDAQGWQRMLRDYPVQTKLYKASQAAGTRLVNAARKEAEALRNGNRDAALPQETRTDTQSDEEPLPELLAAIELSQSFDPKEAAKGHLEIARLTAATVAREIGVDPAAARANKVYVEALTDAVEDFPDLAKYLKNADDRTALDGIVDESKALTALVTAENIRVAMVEAGEELKRRKATAATSAATAEQTAAAARTTAERQKIVRSNARLATADVLNQRGASSAPKQPLRVRLGETIDRFVSAEKQ